VFCLSLADDDGDDDDDDDDDDDGSSTSVDSIYDGNCLFVMHRLVDGVYLPKQWFYMVTCDKGTDSI